MAKFCLIPAKADEFKNKLVDGTLNPDEMSSMSSEERHKLLSGIVGESNAKNVNALFESKLLLKNQKAGYISWAKSVTGLDKKAYQNIEDKVAKLDRLLSPEEEQSFMRDLVDTKLGISISKEEAQVVANLSKEVSERKGKFNIEKGNWEGNNPAEVMKNRLDYGMAKVKMMNHIGDLSGENKPIKQILKERGEEFASTWKENKPMAVAGLGKDVLKTVNDTLIATLASLDDSFIGRQGLKVLFTHPTEWAKAAKESFGDIAKTFGNKEARDILMADVYSRKNYMNGEYQRAGLLPKTEEQFPTSLPERMPYLGKAFKASEVAFEGSAIRMRTGLYDMLAEKAKGNGVEWNNKQVESFGKLVNSLTARGKWGKKGEPEAVRLVFWAPRMIKANIDVLTAHVGQDMTKEARMEAAKNLAKIIGVTGTIMTIANTLNPGSAELDPRSSDFGKIKAGKTRFDITGGAGSIVTLFTRLALGTSNVVGLTNALHQIAPSIVTKEEIEEEKSTSTGKLTKYSTKYGGRTAWDALISFGEGKLAPGARIVHDVIKGETYSGEKPTFISEFPIPINFKNVIEAYQDPTADRIAGAIADFFGISASTYSTSQANLGKLFGKNKVPKSVSDEFDRLRGKDYGPSISSIEDRGDVKSFKDKNPSKYSSFIKEFNDKYSQEVTREVESSGYRGLPIDKKKARLDKIKDSLSDSLLKKYGYRKDKKIKVTEK